MKKWMALMITLFFALSVSPVVFGEMVGQESKISQQTLIAKAKKKPKKKKKKKKRMEANLPIAFILQLGNIKG